MIEIDITVNGDLIINYSSNNDDELAANGKSIHKIRTSSAVVTAKKKVKSRDECCQVCGERDKILEVHHIFPVSKYPALASDEKNMITLCQHCHRKYHDSYDGSEGAETFAKYMRDYGGR